MTQSEQSQTNDASKQDAVSAKATSHETIDPMLDDFSPAATEDPSPQAAMEARKPGAPNATSLPSAAEALAMIEDAEASGDRKTADELRKQAATVPTSGPTVGAGDHDAAEKAAPLDALGIQKLEEQVIDAMRTVYDPEIPVNIYELGLIYELNIDPQGRAVIEMTLTSPACPVAGILPGEVEQKVLSVDGVYVAKVELVWDPPWSPDMMSEAAQLQLGFF